MATLKSKRGPIRAAFTRTLKELDTEVSKPDGNLDQILKLKKKLEDRFLTLEKVDEEIDVVMQQKQASEEDFNTEYESVIEYRDAFNDIIYTVNNLERNNREQNNFDRASSAESSYHTNVDCNARSKYKLPKLELRKFNGDPKEWLSFWSQFKGIDDDVSISAENKFQYLIQAMVQKSPAYDLVTSFPPTGANYPKAIECLKSRFGNDILLIEVYVRELLKLVLSNTIHDKRNSVTALYDKLETQLRGLESLGVTRDKYAAMLYPLVESALPEEVLKTWQRTRYQSANQQGNAEIEDKLSPLMKFLRSEVDSEIRLKLAKTGIYDSSEDLCKNSIMQSVEKKIICFYCKNPGHTKQNCKKYKRWLETGNSKSEDDKSNSRPEANVSQDSPATSKKPYDKAKMVVQNDDSSDDDYEKKTDFLFSIGKAKTGDWNLDSAATRHVCNDKSFFDRLDESEQGTLKMPNGERIKVMGVGTGKLSFLDGNGTTRTATVKEVVYAPSAISNFLSVSKLTKLNYRVEFSRTKAEIKYKNKRIGMARMTESGMFSLRQT